MAEQIMWAVKGPSGALQAMEYGHNEKTARFLFACSCNIDYTRDFWLNMEAKGYRTVRVRVTEVQDA